MAAENQPVELDEVDQSDLEDWIKTISDYDNEFKEWQGRADKIIRRFKDDKRNKAGNGATKFNILWSNLQTVVPAVFSRLPKPDVSRRFRDTDPVGRVASLILERALEFEIEHYPDYRAAMKNSVQDRFLGGRGISWVRYEPHFGPMDDGLQITEDADEVEGEEDNQEEIKYECAPVDYVNWKDFGHSVSRTWEEVTSVWRKVYMERDSLKERFGDELGEKIPLDTRPDDQKRIVGVDGAYQALIYEIWDKRSDSAIWISKSMGQVLDRRKDPLGLENFFPCPRPLYATITSDSLIPVPDFTMYQDQANELDTLSDRIDGLIQMLKVRGVHDASEPSLARLFTEGENGTLIPVKNWQSFSEKQGLRGSIDIIDILPIAQALKIAYEAMKEVKGEIYEITGLADIIRGETDPNETLGAVRIKGQHAGLRLRAMQLDVTQFATEILQIKAQIMTQHFQPQTLLKIAAAQQLSQQDQMMIPAALQLLKDEPLKNFRIEVSTDSMVQMDEQQEKADRMEFLKATGTFLEKIMPLAEAQPEAAPLLVELLKFGVTGFRVGKTIEGVFDAALDKLQQQSQQQRPPKPNPEMEQIHAQAQTDSQQMQLKAQYDSQLLQLKSQSDQQNIQMQAQLEAHKQQLQAQQVAAQNAQEAQREQQKQQMAAQNTANEQHLKMQAEGQRIEFDRWKAELDAATKIMVAQISAKSALDQASMTAEQAAAQTVEDSTRGGDAAAQMIDMHGKTLNAIQGVMQQLAKPRKTTFIKGEDGRPTGAIQE